MKKLIIACAMFSIPMITLAQPMNVVCQLNTPCEMTIQGSGFFNKIIHTDEILVDKTYICTVSSGNGNLFNIHNVHHTPGVQFIYSSTMETPFKIIGPRKGEGAITYTVHNSDKDFWKSDKLRYECRTEK